MEPIRPIIDYQLLKSFNLKQIKQSDFVFKNGRFEFKEGFKTSKIYGSIFLETIISFMLCIREWIPTSPKVLIV